MYFKLITFSPNRDIFYKPKTLNCFWKKCFTVYDLLSMKILLCLWNVLSIQFFLLLNVLSTKFPLACVMSYLYKCPISMILLSIKYPLYEFTKCSNSQHNSNTCSKHPKTPNRININKAKWSFLFNMHVLKVRPKKDFI